MGMAESSVDLKPYRIALEALISHQKPIKLSQMLGYAAANIDDPELRNILKSYISKLPTHKYMPQDPIRMIVEEHVYKNIGEVVSFIEGLIDAGPLSWEILAEKYGWTPPES